jgi:hypothetical protein
MAGKELLQECGGSGICEHGRRKSYCKECGGHGICEHASGKYKECGGSVYVSIAGRRDNARNVEAAVYETCRQKSSSTSARQQSM